MVETDHGLVVTRKEVFNEYWGEWYLSQNQRLRMERQHLAPLIAALQKASAETEESK